MYCSRRCFVVFAAIASVVVSVAWAATAKPEKQYETFKSDNFGRSTTIDNEWFPLKPGMQYVWEGITIDDEGDEEPHRVVFTVTDLTKVINGVRTVVCWDQDYADGELVEAEICFFAQDNDGNVWLMGEYPEEYENGEFVGAPCWIHGIKDTQAGIMMLAEPKVGTPSYSHGWAPSVGFTDRAFVYQTDQKTTVRAGSFDDVLVIDEFNNEEPNAHQLKYYARRIGNIRVGWRGNVSDQETLELVTVEELDTEGLANARDAALQLEKNAYRISRDVFALTAPAQRLPQPNFLNHRKEVTRQGEDAQAAGLTP